MKVIKITKDDGLTVETRLRLKSSDGYFFGEVSIHEAREMVKNLTEVLNKL